LPPAREAERRAVTIVRPALVAAPGARQPAHRSLAPPRAPSRLRSGRERRRSGAGHEAGVDLAIRQPWLRLRWGVHQKSPITSWSARRRAAHGAAARIRARRCASGDRGSLDAGRKLARPLLSRRPASWTCGGDSLLPEESEVNESWGAPQLGRAGAQLPHLVRRRRRPLRARLGGDRRRAPRTAERVERKIEGANLPWGLGCRDTVGCCHFVQVVGATAKPGADVGPPFDQLAGVGGGFVPETQNRTAACAPGCH